MSEVILHATHYNKPSKHLLPFSSLANWARAPVAVGCICQFLLSPDAFGQFDCHGVDELLVPMLRVENLEVKTGNAQNILTATETEIPWCLVLAQEVEQSAHVPRGFLRLPACLVRAEDSRSVCVVSRAWCVL